MVPAAECWDVFQAAIKKDCFGLFPGDDDILDPENYLSGHSIKSKADFTKDMILISDLIDQIME